MQLKVKLGARRLRKMSRKHKDRSLDRHESTTDQMWKVFVLVGICADTIRVGLPRLAHPFICIIFMICRVTVETAKVSTSNVKAMPTPSLFLAKHCFSHPFFIHPHRKDISHKHNPDASSKRHVSSPRQPCAGSWRSARCQAMAAKRCTSLHLK
jgi:hypothetical protein